MIAEPESWPSNISHMVLFGDIGKPKQIMAASDPQRRCMAGFVGMVAAQPSSR